MTSQQQQHLIPILHVFTAQLQNNTLDPISAMIFSETLALPGPLDWKMRLFHWYKPLIASLHLSPSSVFLIYFFWPFILIILFGILIYALYQVIKSILTIVFKLYGNKQVAYTFLELTFPSDTSKSAYATEQLFVQLHALGRQLTFRERLSKYKKLYSLEIVATKKEGIRYIISIPQREKEIVKRSLLSYLPGIKVREISNYLDSKFTDTPVISISELKLSGHPSLPLQKHSALDEHDPIAFIIGNMTKLNVGEQLCYQIVATPILSSVHGTLLREMN